jgi:hypothetical protein
VRDTYAHQGLRAAAPRLLGLGVLETAYEMPEDVDMDEPGGARLLMCYRMTPLGEAVLTSLARRVAPTDEAFERLRAEFWEAGGESDPPPSTTPAQ